MRAPTDWGLSTLSDFANMLVGKPLGSGMSREVYELEIDRTKVVKIEGESGRFQNIIEWETWQALRDHKIVGKYLAPCYYISPCGIALIQARVQPLREEQVGKLKLPDLLGDFKLQNYGMFEGRVVCSDYGTNLSFYRAADRARMRTPKADDWRRS